MATMLYLGQNSKANLPNRAWGKRYKIPAYPVALELVSGVQTYVADSLAFNAWRVPDSRVSESMISQVC